MLASVTSRASPNLWPIIADRRTDGRTIAVRYSDQRVGSVLETVCRYSRTGPRIGGQIFADRSSDRCADARRYKVAVIS